MEEDLRTVRREMLFCDIRNISEENRGLTLVNSTGDIVFRTCYDSSLGAYGIVLDDEKTCEYLTFTLTQLNYRFRILDLVIEVIKFPNE